jgi:hypothetical protein
VNKADIHTRAIGQPAFSPTWSSFPPSRCNTVVVRLFTTQEIGTKMSLMEPMEGDIEDTSKSYLLSPGGFFTGA